LLPSSALEMRSSDTPWFWRITKPYFSYAAPSACAKREGDGQGRKGTTNLAPI
jgi:hypothetical protein